MPSLSGPFSETSSPSVLAQPLYSVRKKNLGTSWRSKGLGQMGEGKPRYRVQIAFGSRCKMSDVSTENTDRPARSGWDGEKSNSGKCD